MAQFRATIKGQKGGEASRLGDKNSGISAHVAGWSGGVGVEASHHPERGDEFAIYATTGSNGSGGFGDLIGKVDAAGKFTAGIRFADLTSDTEKARRGGLIAEVLNLRADREGRYKTEWGTKTALGIFETVRRLALEGK